VEISKGGLDFSNPDALCGIYPGEFEEFEDPRKAMLAAIRILKLWRKDGEKDANIACGCTLGFTMEFDPIEDPLELHRWVQNAIKKSNHCEVCGDICDGIECTDPFGERFIACSEYCIQKYYEDIYDNDFGISELEDGSDG
jgi:hypothetical protein